MPSHRERIAEALRDEFSRYAIAVIQNPAWTEIERTAQRETYVQRALSALDAGRGQDDGVEEDLDPVVERAIVVICDLMDWPHKDSAVPFMEAKSYALALHRAGLLSGGRDGQDDTENGTFGPRGPAAQGSDRPIFGPACVRCSDHAHLPLLESDDTDITVSFRNLDYWERTDDGWVCEACLVGPDWPSSAARSPSKEGGTG